MDDFEQRAADISVEHPELVEKYRTANGIARASERGEASTDDLRHSVRHFRALFVDLLEVDEDVDEDLSRDREVEDVRAHENVQRLR
jgi:pyridoxal biosynthesis lyase PdxS